VTLVVAREFSSLAYSSQHR